MDLRHDTGNRQLLGMGTFVFFSNNIKLSPKFSGRGEKKFLKNYSQAVGNWCVVFTSMRESERTFLGMAVIFLNKLHMCLPMKSTLVHGTSVPRVVACSQVEGSHKELCRLCQMKETSQRRQNSSHLFLRKSLCFIFNPSSSQFSLLGKACQGAMTTLFFLPKGAPSFAKAIF